MAEWRRLGSSLSGSLVLPSSPAYATDRLLYNSKFVNPHPAAIAYCSSAEDVKRCVDFVASHEVDVAARSGGHSYGGYSSCDGLVIDVSRLDWVKVDTKANVAKVGAGARMIDVYNAIGSRNRLLPGGSCPSVGVAGLTLGGGVGVFGRKFGLTSDNLRSAKFVTAAGEHLSVDPSSHPSLLWACRGGGGGNFGIVTSFEFDVHPMPQVTLFSLQYPWEAAANVLEAWQHWITLMPDELWSNCQLLSQGSYGFLIQISGVFCGTQSALATLLTRLHSSSGTPPSSTFVGSDDYVEAMKIEAGCSNLSIAACHLPTDSRQGVLSREAYSAKSSYLDAPTTSAHATLLVHAVEVLKDYAPTVGGGLAFDAYGGAINRVEKHQTAFVHRDKLAGIQATYSWSSYTSPSEIAAGQRWLTWLGSDVFRPQTGAYQNYIDPTLADWKTAYYGTNLERLVKVKRTYDPENLFSFDQSIPVHL
ncbi:MAG TPA: FAD-binding oxidoreductase [Acidimicrobiales bacterium]|nr:FAD-binding oxidoreductase [Acidimicrobiales bacterium]